MKVFISFSINDKDQFILTNLGVHLSKRGYQIYQSEDFNQSSISSLTKINISKADLFIGLITKKSFEQKRIMSKWRAANTASIPAILLVENTVNINPNFKFPYIIFDRKDPKKAIEQLQTEISKREKNEIDNTDALNWILGGAALLVMLHLFDKK
jgi:hypothetical protein